MSNFMRIIKQFSKAIPPPPRQCAGFSLTAPACCLLEFNDINPPSDAASYRTVQP